MPKPSNHRRRESSEMRNEQKSTYFVEDRTKQEELDRLRVFDRMLTTAMGGVLSEQADRNTFQQVLDVGCGIGGWLIEVAESTPTCTKLVGVDVSLKFVEDARAQAKAHQVGDRVEFVEMDALQKLDFPDHSFDLVNQRSGISWLRTWDWPRLLQEYLRMCRPGGVVRITEPNELIESNGSAFARLQELWLQAFYPSGHLFTPTGDGLTSHLERLLQHHGLQQVQTRPYTLEYRAGTPELQLLFENNKLFFQTIVPFLKKWVRLPEDYETLYQEMLSEMQQPDFVATVRLLTAWGIAPPQASESFPVVR